MIGLKGQPHSLAQVEGLGELVGQLQSADAVEHRELLGDVLLLPVFVDLAAPQHLGGGAAVADLDRAVDVVGDGGVVGHDEGCDAQSLVDPAHGLEHVCGCVLVELAGRLVGQEHPRVVREGDRDRGALLLAAGELGRPAVGAVTDLEQVEELHDAAFAVFGLVAGDGHRHRDVLRRREIGQQVAGGLLPDEPDTVPLVLHALLAPHREQVASRTAGHARGRGVEAGEDREQRRLAGPGCADERHHLAAADTQVEPLQCLNLDPFGGEDAHEVGAQDVRLGVRRNGGDGVRRWSFGHGPILPQRCAGFARGSRVGPRPWRSRSRRPRAGRTRRPRPRAARGRV